MFSLCSYLVFLQLAAYLILSGSCGQRCCNGISQWRWEAVGQRPQLSLALPGGLLFMDECVCVY